MARNRTIAPSLWTDELFLAVSLEAGLTYIGTISHSDDEGRIRWAPAEIYAKVFPRMDVTPKKVEGWMSELVVIKLVCVYEIDQKLYAHLPKWVLHQYVNKPQPSTLPVPTCDHPGNEELREQKRRGNGTIPLLVTDHARGAHVPSLSVSDSLSDSNTKSVSVSGAKPVSPSRPEAVDFADLESDVAVYIALLADENKTGKISPQRVTAVRRHLRFVMDEIDHDAFAYGLRAANSASAPNVNYVKKAARSYNPSNVRQIHGRRNSSDLLPVLNR